MNWLPRSERPARDWRDRVERPAAATVIRTGPFVVCITRFAGEPFAREWEPWNVRPCDCEPHDDPPEAA